MSGEKMISVLELIQSASGWLEKQGVPEARLNVEHLLARQLKKKGRMELYLEFDRPLGEADLGPFRETLRQRAKRIPLQHLLGDVEFHGRRFKSDARALIPRPETEQLVSLALEKVRSTNSESSAPPKILDVGTGSGVIALTLALEVPEADVTATDLSPAALDLARENAESHGLTGRVRFCQSHLLPAEDSVGPWDLVVANLPYIPSGEIAALSPEVGHDPAMALDGGPDGLDLVRSLLDTLPPRLAPGAWLLLELGQGQCGLLIGEISQKNYHSVRAASDWQGIERFLTARYG